MRLVRHEFGPEGAAYIRSYLESNHRFGKRLGRLLARRGPEAGTTWAFVPSDSSLHKRRAFEDGGLFPDPGEEVEFAGGVLRRVHDPAEEPQIVAWLSDLMVEDSRSNRVLCVDDAHLRRSDFRLLDSQRRVFFCGDDVYEYALAGDPLENPIRQARGAASWEPNVAMVSTLPTGVEEGFNSGQSIADEALEAMATAAVAVIVGAWDGEGLVFWEPIRAGHGR